MSIASADTLISVIERGRPSNGSQLFARTATGVEVSYDELDRRVGQLSNALTVWGIGVGDRVAVQVDKSIAAVALHLALLRSGAVQLPLNPAYTDAEVSILLLDARPAMVIRPTGRTRLTGDWANHTLDADGTGSLLESDVGSLQSSFGAVVIGPADPAAMLYTSGTTGRPKAAVLSHGNLAHNATTLVQSWSFGTSDHLLHILPLFHTHGLFVALHCVLASGSSMTLLGTFDVDTALAELPRATVLMGVPTHYSRLLDHPDFGPPATDHIRLFTSGSAPMPLALHERFRQRIGSIVVERYGMTETSMLTSNPLDGVRKPGSVGPPLPGVGVRIADEADAAVASGTVGQVQVFGPNVFASYWERPELQSTQFTADGWFRTGDLGRFDEDGYLELVGRSKDLIISGGMNVYPVEVESVLDAMDGVIESAVVGLADDDFGEVVTAALVMSPGADFNPAHLRAACRDRLAGFKVPKQIVQVTDLPRNAMGKVEKAKLRDALVTSPSDAS